MRHKYSYKQPLNRVLFGAHIARVRPKGLTLVSIYTRYISGEIQRDGDNKHTNQSEKRKLELCFRTNLRSSAEQIASSDYRTFAWFSSSFR